jgi:hypothetical protein
VKRPGRNAAAVKIDVNLVAATDQDYVIPVFGLYAAWPVLMDWRM